MTSQPARVQAVRDHPITFWSALVARLVLGGVLLAAAALKLDDPPEEQVRAVRAYELLPHGVDAAVGYTLPLAELLLAAALILGVAVRTAGILSGLLMLAFIVGVASAWARGLTIDCGCFGGGGQVAADETAYPQEIVRDVGLLLLAAFLAAVGPGRYALANRLRRRRTHQASGQDTSGGSGQDTVRELAEPRAGSVAEQAGEPSREDDISGADTSDVKSTDTRV